MKNLHCPAYITALIHFHCYAEPLRDSPINQDATEDFLRTGLIEIDDEPDDENSEQPRYRTTARGKAYVASLCLVPPPSLVFADAAGNTFDAMGNLINPDNS